MELANTEPVLGEKAETVCCPKLDTGLFDAAIKSKSAAAIFVGHDHVNDYCGHFKTASKFELCYGRKSGWGYYNPTIHGARVIEIKVDSGKVTWTSWIRDEFGDVVDQQWHNPGPAQKRCGSSGLLKTIIKAQ